MFNHTVNDDETTLPNFRYKKQNKKKIIIKIINSTYTNPALLTPSLWDQQQSGQKKESTNTYNIDIGSTMLCQD